MTTRTIGRVVIDQTLATLCFAPNEMRPPALCPDGRELRTYH